MDFDIPEYLPQNPGAASELQILLPLSVVHGNVPRVWKGQFPVTGVAKDLILHKSHRVPLLYPTSGCPGDWNRRKSCGICGMIAQ